MKREDLKKIKEHLIHKIIELAESDKEFTCNNVTTIIDSFSGVPDPPTDPKGGGTR